MQFQLFWLLCILHNIHQGFLTLYVVTMRKTILLRIDVGFERKKAAENGGKRRFCYV